VKPIAIAVGISKPVHPVGVVPIVRLVMIAWSTSDCDEPLFVVAHQSMYSAAAASVHPFVEHAKH